MARARETCRPRRLAGDGHRGVRVRAQRASPGDAARTRGSATRGRRHAGGRGRGIDPRSPRRRESRRPQEFRRRGLRQTVAGDPGGGTAEGDVDRRRRAAEPARVLPGAASQETVARHAARELEGRRRDAGEGVDRAEGDLSASVPDARVDRELVRGGGRAGRQGDDLVADAVGLSDAERIRAAARAPGRARARDFHPRLRLLRDQRRRHRVLRRRAAVAGGRQAGARAAVAARRDGVGELRRRVRDRSARRARRRRRDPRVGLRGLVAGAGRSARATTAPAT